MDSATALITHDRSENLRGTLLLSILLHGMLFSLAAGYAVIGPHIGRSWGQEWSAAGAARVGAVASLPGVPLPAPMRSTPSTVATESPGLYKTEPQEQLVPPPQAEEIPKFEREVKREPPKRVATRIQKEKIEPPPHAVPFGQGGPPQMSHSQFANPAGSGGFGFGDGQFGDRYGWYVAAVRNRVSANWLLATISPHITQAPRVYVTFDILRDGTITNVNVRQSSGNPEVDRSALRAVLASNPLGPLPPDYPGNKVSVEFYFDFQRQ
jgi:TonB family protein